MIDGGTWVPGERQWKKFKNRTIAIIIAIGILLTYLIL